MYVNRHRPELGVTGIQTFMSCRSA